MLQEVLEALRLSEGSTVCDCTLGGAGHSVKMAAQVGEEGLLIGIDQDDMALAAARTRLASEAPGVPLKLLKGNFGDLDELLCRAEVPGIDGILFDLGVSSPQLDIPGRGFSYHEDAPLDMRMDPGNNPLNAAEVINTYNEADLARILRVYGEEKFSDKIAREIVRRRQLSPIETTGELVEAIKAGIPAAARRHGHHPARKSFQAIRIEVNHELDVLERGLEAAVRWLNPGGRICAGCHGRRGRAQPASEICQDPRGRALVSATPAYLRFHPAPHQKRTVNAPLTHRDGRHAYHGVLRFQCGVCLRLRGDAGSGSSPRNGRGAR